MNFDIPTYAYTPSEESSSLMKAAVSRGMTPLDQLPLAIAYVPMQMFAETYDGLRALERGTIFPDLDLPFMGRGVK